MNSGPIMPPAVRWLLIVLPFLGFWLTGLTDVDEGFYGAIAANMIRSGDWIIPTYQGLPWFEKPVLVFWMAGAAIKVFGLEIGPRLPSVLASLGTIWVCNWFAARHFSVRCGEIVGLILSGSLLFAVVGQMLLADPFLVLGLTGAFLLWTDSAIKGNRNWTGAAVFVGVALLAKGPVGVFLFAAVAIWTCRADGGCLPLAKTPWIAFAAIALATASIWYVPALVRSPQEFWGQFVVQQNFYRFLGGDLAHRAPALLNLPYYVVVLGIAMAPWWWFALKGWPRRSVVIDARQAALNSVARWAAVVIVLFTLMGSKLPHYILPAVVPLAILASERLSLTITRDNLRRRVALLAAMPIVATLVANVAALTNDRLSGARESRELAAMVRADQAPVVAFQIRTRKRDLSLKFTPQETSLPSLGLYFGREPIEVEDRNDLLKQKTPYWIFTRRGRLKRDDTMVLRRTYSKFETASGELGKFELYRVE